MLKKFYVGKKTLAFVVALSFAFVSFVPLVGASAAELDMAISENTATEQDISIEEANSLEANGETAGNEAIADTAAAPLIMIDPGHVYRNGVADSGNVAPDGTKEATLTMRIAPKVIKELQSKGYKVITTLPVVEGVPSTLTPPNLNTVDRARVSNEQKPDLFLSLHFNATDSASANGSLVLYDENQLVLDSPTRQENGAKAGSNPALASSIQPKSKKLATAIRDRFHQVAEFDMKGNRYSGLQSQGADVYTFNNAPAVTLEMGFLSNSYDLEYCKNDAKQNRMAQAIAMGVQDYLGTSPSGITVGSLNLGEKGTSTTKPDFVMNAKSVVSSGSAISSVKFIAKNNSSGTTYSYNGTNHINNDWKATFNVANFAYKPGNYTITVEAKNSAGQVSNNVSKNITLVKDSAKPVAGTMSFENPQTSGFKVISSGITAKNSVRTVVFKLWKDGDKNVYQKFTAKKNSNGSYSADIKLDKFGNKAGTYVVQQLVYDKWNNSASSSKKLNVKSTTSDKDKPNMEKLVFGTKSPTTQTSFGITAKNVADASGVKEVKFRILNESMAGAKAKSIKATQSGTDWNAQFSISDFENRYGKYKINVYSTDNAGNTGVIGTGYIEIKTAITQTPIMGNANVAVAQMVNYFKVSGYKYPSHYTEAGRNMSLKQLAQTYYDVSAAEGVRPEIAWVQMCLETGYLQFGGDVNIGQFNFAGLGATGGGVSGFDFAKIYGDNAEGIRYGVIGHVQHLKLYASKANVHFLHNGKPIDPRWDAAISAGRRGCAPNVENLENNWAMSPQYSKNILDGLAILLGMSAQTDDEEIVEQIIESAATLPEDTAQTPPELEQFPTESTPPTEDGQAPLPEVELQLEDAVA